MYFSTKQNLTKQSLTQNTSRESSKSIKSIKSTNSTVFYLSVIALIAPLLFFSFSACQGAADAGKFSISDLADGLSIGDVYGTSEERSSGWELVHDGLPLGDFSMSRLVAWKGNLYVAVSDSDDAYDSKSGNGIYVLDNPYTADAVWRKVLESPIKYGMGQMAAASLDGGSEEGLFVVAHSKLYRAVESGGELIWANEASPVGEYRDEAGNHDAGLPYSVGDIIPVPAAQGGGVLLIESSTSSAVQGNPRVYRFVPAATNTGSGNWEDYGGPPGDGKPHMNIAMNPANGDIWFKTQETGVYRRPLAGGTDASWTKVSEKSASMAFDSSGYPFISYEITPTTQIATIFRGINTQPSGSDDWGMVFSTRGYSAPLSPFGPDMFASVGGRFNSLVVGKDRAYSLPNPRSGLNLSSDATKSVSTRNIVVHSNSSGQTIYAAQGLPRGGGNTALRLIRHSPDLASLPFYLNNVSLADAVLVDDARGLSEAVGLAGTGSGLVLGINSLVLTNEEYQPVQGHLYTRDGTTLSTAYSLDANEKLLHLAGNDDSMLVVATEKRVYTANPAAPVTPERELVNETSSKRRVAIGADASLALLNNNNEVQYYAPGAGNPAFTLNLERSYTEDVAIDSERGLLYVVGYDNKSLPGGNPVQVAWFAAYSTSDGSWQGQVFGFDGGNLENNIADTRLYRVNVGRDGAVHVLGESAGTESIFRYDGTSFSGESILRSFDFYNDLWNTGSAHFAYHAVIAPDTMRVAKGQFTMTRLSSGKGNSFRIKNGDITADRDGRVFVGASAAAHIAHRDAQSVEGVSVGSYSGGEPSLLGIAPAYAQRVLWTTFNRNSLNGTINEVLVDNSPVAADQTLYALMSVWPADSATGETFSDDGSAVTISGRRSVLVSIPLDQFIPEGLK